MDNIQQKPYKYGSSSFISVWPYPCYSTFSWSLWYSLLFFSMNPSTSSFTSIVELPLSESSLFRSDRPQHSPLPLYIVKYKWQSLTIIHSKHISNGAYFILQLYCLMSQCLCQVLQLWFCLFYVFSLTVNNSPLWFLIFSNLYKLLSNGTTFFPDFLKFILVLPLMLRLPMVKILPNHGLLEVKNASCQFVIFVFDGNKFFLNGVDQVIVLSWTGKF